MHIFTVHTFNFSWDATYSAAAAAEAAIAYVYATRSIHVRKRHIKFNKWHNFYLLYGICAELLPLPLPLPLPPTPTTTHEWTRADEKHEVISIIKFIGQGTNLVTGTIFFFFTFSLIRSRISYSTQSLHLFKTNSFSSMCTRFNVAPQP